MKQTLLLSALALSLVANAQADARKWDFRQWSAETVANLEAGAFANSNSNAPASGWSDVEKSGGAAPTDLSAKNCYWQISASGSSVDGTLVANGTAIKELEGLRYVNGTDRSLAIAVNYQGPLGDGFGPYEGASYLWLGSSKKNYFVIPSVEVGTKIYMGIESHKTTDARGVQLYVWNGSARGTQITGEDGADAPAAPTTYEEQVWQVQEGLTDTPNEDGTYDLVIYNTNGCHLYYITVGEDEGFEPTEVNVAYLYDATYNTTTSGYGWGTNGGLDEDPVYNVLQSYNTTAIDFSQITSTTDEFNESLLDYDVVVLGEAVASGNKYATALVDIVNKVPMLNLKSFMYKKGVWTWGAGSNPSPKATTIQVAEDYRDSELFADVNMDDEGNIVLFDVDDVSTVTGGNLIQGYTVTAGSLIDGDEVIATVSGINAIHQHGTKNAYLLIPISSDNMNYLSEDASMLLYNAIGVLAQTKSKVQNAAAPVIAQSASDGVTYVTLSSATAGNTIYYTLDGSDPTVESAVYAGETFEIKVDGTVVKAFAVAHGYNESAVSTATISVQSQLAAPTISLAAEQGQTVITLAQEAGAPIYYSFTGMTTTATAALYTEPVAVTEPGTVYAFAASASALQSELASADITVEGIPAVGDTLAHFNASETDWYTNAVLSDDALQTGSASAFYYFGKSAWNYYSDEVDHTEVAVDAEGNKIESVFGGDSIVNVYKLNPEALRTITSTTDTQWIIKSAGQVVTGELQLAPEAGVGNGNTGRYADAAIDGIGGVPTKGVVDFGGKVSGEPYTMSVESTVTFSGSFDVVAYLGNGTSGGTPVIAVQTSADGVEWTSVDTLNYSTTQRYWKKTRTHVSVEAPVYVRVAQLSGSSKAQLYDVIIVATDGLTGIQTLSAGETVASERLYDLQGRAIAAPAKGQLYIKGGKKAIAL